jgi:hypothetical protein
MIATLRAIEIPREFAWTDTRATEWWQTHRPATAPAPSTDSLPRTIVPLRAAPNGATVQAKLSSRRDKA